MKIFISYPPLESAKGIPLLTQNRQFQWFNSPTYIYPMVPASAATLLARNGYGVVWDDAIAEGKSYAAWLANVKREKPDLIVLETKTPVVKRHWRIIDELKKESLEIGNWKLEIVLIGDHVTALPEESLSNSQVDYVLTGGDYDFMLLNLANHLAKDEALEPGWYFRSAKGKAQNAKLTAGDICTTGKFQLNHDLDSLPMIDRELTKWELYAYRNGNYKQVPSTYVMSARDCWWGKCSFCSWTTIFPGAHFRARSPKLMLDEIGLLIERYGVKEIMDDSGSLPIGGWLREFCQGMIERGYSEKVRLNCNMRLNALNQEEYDLMGRAGFRFVLYGLESANQATLDKVNKNLKVEEMEPGVRMAKRAGLDPHITAMVGYPWETYEDAQRTVELAKCLFKKGYVDTLQATIVIPYPGTPYFKECRDNGWLKTTDWDRYDMREAVVKTPLTDGQIKELTQGLYKSFLSPQFIVRKILSVRSWADVKFILRAGKKVLGHLLDFRKRG